MVSLIVKVKVVISITKSYQPILLIFNNIHRYTPEYLESKFGENLTKNATVRVPQRKKFKWPP